LLLLLYGHVQKALFIIQAVTRSETNQKSIDSLLDEDLQNFGINPNIVFWMNSMGIQTFGVSRWWW